MLRVAVSTCRLPFYPMALHSIWTGTRMADIQMVSALLVGMLQSCPILPKNQLFGDDSEAVCWHPQHTKPTKHFLHHAFSLPILVNNVVHDLQYAAEKAEEGILTSFDAMRDMAVNFFVRLYQKYANRMWCFEHGHLYRCVASAEKQVICVFWCISKQYVAAGRDNICFTNVNVRCCAGASARMTMIRDTRTSCATCARTCRPSYICLNGPLPSFS